VTVIVTGRDALDGVTVGGKARALAALELAGFDVPGWFVVTPDAFLASVPDEDRGRLAHASDDEIAAIVERFTLAGEVAVAVAAALRTLCPDGRRVAVRSSAVDEDAIQHSFAGQLESFLNVGADAVPARIADVWRSGFSARILAYRRQHRLAMPPPAPAVLVQRMVDARVSGVAFSADPVSGRRRVAVVSAVPGLATVLVSGEGDADSWQVARLDAHGNETAASIIGRTITAKQCVHRSDVSQPDGIRVDTLGEPLASQPALRDDEVLAVARLARRAAMHFHRPQDIEWAIEDARLYLLQSRAITSLALLPDPDDELRIWDNSNIVESYSGVTTPLTFSFATEIYEHVYRQFCRMMRVPEGAVLAADDVFRNMLGLIRGRMYYNLINWYRVLALLPGFAINRRFMEQMMGVAESLPAAVTASIERDTKRAPVVDAWHVASTAGGLIAQHFTIERRVRQFYARLDRALVPPEPPLGERSPDELVAHYRDLREALLLKWDAPLVNDFFAMIFYGVLRKLTARWCGDTDGTLQNDLVGGEGGLVSAEPAERLTRLAVLASRDPAFAALLIHGDGPAIAAAIAAQPDFAAAYRAYLDKFGERSVNELKLETETLHDDPLPLVRAIGHMVVNQGGRPHAAMANTGATRRAEAQRRVRDALRSHPLRRLVFGWVLRQARARVRDRENLRLERTRLFGRVRRIFVELGRRFAVMNVLDDPRDVFFLEVDEVLSFVDGRSTCASLGALAAVRRGEFAEYERQPAPPARFETRGSVYHAQDLTDTTPAAAAAGDQRKGQGCCPGVVRGPVRLVRDPRHVDLSERAVLVAEHTDPGWILVLPSALGVLVERGSLLSHAAIVTRELGIPSIVGLPGITRWLEDGDWVEMDGRAGTVRRIGPDAHDTAGVQDTRSAAR
jgi:phosphohistidine swiveling domain-containing protein